MRSPALRAQKQYHNASQTLSQAEQRYVEARAEGTPPVPSTKIAGLSPEKARNLDNDPRIRACLDALNRLNAFDRELTRDDVLQGFYEATQMAANASELTAAWREIGKVVGAYEPRKLEISVNDRQQLRELSDDELQQQLSGEVIDGEYRLLEFDDSENDSNVPVEPPDDA